MRVPHAGGVPSRRPIVPPPAADRVPDTTGWLLLALGAAVALRGLSAAGSVAALGAAVLGARWRPGRLTARSLGWGLGGTALLMAGPAVRGTGVAHAPVGHLLPWAAGVAVVVAAEEAFLRGALWRACEQTWGSGAALAVTTVGFALLHLPVYGWRALPLDTAVGAVLGGLRMASGGVWAPGVAHLGADWAAWWL